MSGLNTPCLSIDQLKLYLARIGLEEPSPTQPRNLDFLNKVIHAQASHIPFENAHLRFLNVKPKIQIESLVDHLVVSKRGGYCFQVNTLLLAALKSLGFEASSGVARISAWDPDLQEYTFGALTHMIVFIDVSGTLFLADLGYGQEGLTCAIELKAGARVDSIADEQHGIKESDVTGAGNFIVCHKRAAGAPLAVGVDPNGDQYFTMYYCTKEKYRPIDYEGFNFYVSHNPAHIFNRIFTVAIVTPTGGRSWIVDRKFKRREGMKYRDLEKVVDMKSVEEFADIMESEFGLVMSEDEKEGAKRLLFAEIENK
ncbi:hypothetical protein BDR26DRAFT_857000 [Obelidium mucronatum]|nr:hypothetical protein BDR26DRAFT_857000 [Obelidium mucronatum]